SWPRFRGIGRVLLRVSTFEHDRGRPLLSALVVQAASRRAGDGFAELGRDLSYQIEEGQERAFWRGQVEEVVRYWTGAGQGSGGPAHAAQPTVGFVADGLGELRAAAGRGPGTTMAPLLLSEDERPIEGPARVGFVEGRGFSRMAPTLYRDTGYTLTHL